MPPAEFCRVELGLYFLATYFPGEPVGVLQPVLSGYVRVGQDLDAVARRVQAPDGRRGAARLLAQAAEPLHAAPGLGARIRPDR